MPLPIYTIQVNGQYFKGVSDDVVGTTGDRKVWYSHARDLYALEFTPNEDEAKRVEGKRNMNSYLDKMMEHQRQRVLDIDEIIIKRIGED